ncbi:MAG: secondary thiamine-phosphate synthase enzyme YjbQ [Candidatus Brocadiales bacterium]
MPIISVSKEITTNGDTDCRNITPEVQETVKASGITSGLVTVFIPGSTAAVTTIEFEEGVVSDLSGALERLIPKDISYKHDKRWHDGNGFSHVRAAFLGPSLTVPFTDGELQLGTWQQIVLLDFDNRKRGRRYLINIMGEK